MRWEMSATEPRQQIRMSEETAEALRAATHMGERRVLPVLEELVQAVGLQPLLEIVDNTLELGVVKVEPFYACATEAQVADMERELERIISESGPEISDVARAIVRAGYRKAP